MTSPVYVYVFTAVVIAFWAWRFLSRLRPSDASLEVAPLVQPYIPWPITVCRFLWDIQGFMRRCEMCYGPVFRFRLAGTTVVVVSHAEGISHILRDSQKCLSNALNQSILDTVGGVSPQPDIAAHSVLLGRLISLLKKTFATRNSNLFAAPFKQSLIHTLESFPCQGDVNRVSLATFVGQCLYDSLCMSFAGPTFPTDTFAEFSSIDQYSVRFLMPFWTPPAKIFQARRSLKSKLGVFIERAAECPDAKDGCAFSGIEIAKMLRAQPNLSPSDEQGIFLGLMLAMHANTIRMVIWFMSYLLSDVDAMNRLREEIDHAVDVDFGSLESLLSAPPHRLDGEAFPLLNSGVKEVLRLCVAAVTVREVTKSSILQLGGNHFTFVQNGDYVIADGYGINANDRYFEQANTFRLDRFVLAKRGDLASEYLEPLSSFGGGAHMCKGRDFALYEMRLFVIICLRLFKLEGETSKGESTIGRTPEAVSLWPTPVFFPKETFVRILRRDVLE